VHPDQNPNLKRYPESRTWIYENYTLSERADRVVATASRPPHKYYFSVMAMFKNEAHIMQEWLDHHIGDQTRPDLT